VRKFQKNKNVKRFLSYVKKELKTAGFSIKISPTLNVFTPCKLKTSGYFLLDTKQIVVAGKSRWLEVLTHEFCHFLQYTSQCKQWITTNELDRCGYTIENIVDQKIKFTKPEINLIVEANRNLELDCEKRTVQLIQEWGLPINVEEYIQDCNVYLFLYTHINKNRKWHKKYPGDLPEIQEMVPTKFLKSYKKMPKGFEEMVNNNCF